MIERLRGTILEKSPTALVVESGGIGFAVGVPLSTSQRVGGAGAQVALYARLVIREQSWELYGFSEIQEREIFDALTSVSGIGPKAALNLLSRMGTDEIKRVIARSDIDLLTTVPGIGKKRAAQIVFELNDRMAKEPAAAGLPDDALKALIALGLKRREAVERLRKIKDIERLSVSDILTIALKGE